jgi:hypothetical protein
VIHRCFYKPFTVVLFLKTKYTSLECNSVAKSYQPKNEGVFGFPGKGLKVIALLLPFLSPISDALGDHRNHQVIPLVQLPRSWGTSPATPPVPAWRQAGQLDCLPALSWRLFLCFKQCGALWAKKHLILFGLALLNLHASVNLTAVIL